MLSSQNNITISRMLNGEVDGKVIPVVSLNAQIAPGKALSISMSVIDSGVAAANAEALTEAFDSLVAHAKQVAKESGFPI